MTTTGAKPPLLPEAMSDEQRARRAGILQAVLDAAADGSLETMQMKDIAERADVALGTIYNYFSSREHVLAAAMLEWVRGYERRAATLSSAGTMAERLMRVIRQGIRPYQHRPGLAHLMATVSTVTDPFANECVVELVAIVRDTLARALPELDPAERDRVLRVVTAVWDQGFGNWVRGRTTLTQFQEDLENACDQLLAWREPS